MNIHFYELFITFCLSARNLTKITLFSQNQMAAGVVDLSTTKCEAAKIFVKP